MEKIKNFLKNASKQLQDVFKRFPITIILVVLVTFFAYLQLQFEIMVEEEFAQIISTMIVFGVGVIFVESFDKKKSIFTYVGLIIAAIVSIIYYPIFKDFDKLEENKFLLGRILCIYTLISAFGTVFVLHRKSGIPFKEYVTKVFLNLLKTSIYYAVFCLGTITIFIIFEVLIFSNGYEVYFNLLFLTFGWIYTPIVINCFIDLEEKESSFLKGLITFVLYPIAIISTALIYVYFIKIIISNTFLHKRIFEVIAWLFVSSFPVMIMANVLKEKAESKKLNMIYCIAYIPFVIMEMYSMSIRVSDYGLTIPRYFAYVFVIMQIIVIALLLYKNGEKLNYMLIALAAATIICGIGPTNAIDVSIKSQEQRLAKELNGVSSIDDLDSKKVENIVSIVRYLKRNDDEKYVNSIITEEMKEKIEEGNYRYEEFSTTKSKHLSQSLSDLDITTYKGIHEAKGGYDYNQNNNNNNKMEFHYSKNINSFEVDMNSLIKEIIEFDDNSATSVVIKTNDPNVDFYFDSISFSYDTETNEIDDIYYVTGYLLEKITE